MSDIVEILRGEFRVGWSGNPGAQTDYMSFTANNAVSEVVLNNVAVPYTFIFANAGGNVQFQPRDNVMLLSTWLALPYAYSLSRPGAVVGFGRANVVASVYLREVSPPSGSVFVPVAGAEISLGVFCPWEIGYLPQEFPVLCVGLIQGAVSQIGAPASLNGTKFYPTVFVKVKHSIPMV